MQTYGISTENLAFKVIVRAEILPRDFLQTLDKLLVVTYYMYSQNSKFKISLLKQFVNL